MNDSAETRSTTGVASNGGDPQEWLPRPLQPINPMRPRYVVLAALFFVLLAVVLMVGVPLLNAHFLASGGGGDPATWQITANITMVGMLVAGVFVITALRMEYTARYTAWNETNDFLMGSGQAFYKEQAKCIEDKTGKLLGQQECKGEKLLEQQRGEGKTLLEQQRGEGKTLLEQQRGEGKALLDAEVERHRQARDTLNDFVSAQAAGLADNDDMAKAVQSAISELIRDTAAKEVLIEGVRQYLADHPEPIIDGAANLVRARARWRWLFKPQAPNEPPRDGQAG